ncbi:unnamed protein product [marine sediment metagenome]|jgi:hypothetical protein|uniref:Uncharacterized protein n=1 Tax=marine sediment metagenome TaxID=412755 RepID=X1DEC8_9ZZZZ
MVKDKENVDVVILIEQLLGGMVYIYAAGVFMKLGEKLDLKGSNKLEKKKIRGYEKIW